MLRNKSVRYFTSIAYNVEREKNVYQVLNQIIEPITGKTVGDIGVLYGSLVTNDGTVAIKMNFNVPGYPHQEKIKSECEQALSSFAWVRDIKFESTVNPPINSNGSLTKVKHIIGVSSCKGGVGKSTIAVNLAMSLAMKGLRTGLLDADIYGPSIPLLLKAKDVTVRRSSINMKNVCPLTADCNDLLKFISFGHVNPNAGAPGAGGKSAALMRGPMASKVLNQLLLCTEWGELDYLIIDMPPGTGDIQLTLCQNTTMSGAVVVTTPHSLALADVAKGIDMFSSLSIPIIGLVENMSYFKCSHGTFHYPFGRGGKDRITKYLQLQCSTFDDAPYIRLPLFMDFVDEENSQIPFVLKNPDNEGALQLKKLGDDVISSLFKHSVNASQIPSVQLDHNKNAIRVRYFNEQQAEEYFISSSELRSFIGLNKSDIPLQRMAIKGKFGISIVWEDNSSIFSFDMLSSIIRDKRESS